MIHLAFLQDIKLGQITQGDLRGKSTWQTSAKILEIRSLLLTHIKYYPLFSIYCERTVEKLGGRAGLGLGLQYMASGQIPPGPL